jgi:hypothetical protein
MKKMHRFLFRSNKGWKKIRERENPLLETNASSSSTTTNEATIKEQEATPTTSRHETEEAPAPLSPKRLLPKKGEAIEKTVWDPFSSSNSSPLLQRSLSHDSFSTITTAAETPPGGMSSMTSNNMIVWADNVIPPTEICLLSNDIFHDYPNAAAVLKLQGQSPLPPPLLPPRVLNDSENNSTEGNKNVGGDSPGSKDPLAFDTLYTQNIMSAVNDRPALRRTHSGGLDPYLRAPDRFTRFEI